VCVCVFENVIQTPRLVVQTRYRYLIHSETRAGFASVWLFTFFVVCWLCPEWGRVSSLCLWLVS